MSSQVTKKEVQDIVSTAVNGAVDDLSAIINTFASHIDSRFNVIESQIAKLQRDVDAILNRLDSIEKQLEIDDDERAVMGMQLTRLHDWVEKAAQKIGVEFVH
jgi:cob(I)alamin adenosyltransferase